MFSFLVPNVSFLCFRITQWNLLKVTRMQGIQEKRLSYCTMVYYCTISLSLLNLLLLISKWQLAWFVYCFQVVTRSWVVLLWAILSGYLIILGQMSGHTLLQNRHLFLAICPGSLWARDNRWLLSRVQRLAGPAGDGGLLSRFETPTGTKWEPFVPVGGSNRDKRLSFCPGWCLKLGQKAPVPRWPG